MAMGKNMAIKITFIVLIFLASWGISGLYSYYQAQDVNNNDVKQDNISSPAAASSSNTASKLKSHLKSKLKQSLVAASAATVNGLAHKTTVCSNGICSNPDKNAENLRQYLENMIENLSDEELEILEKYSPDQLKQAIVDAEQNYRNASDADREAADHHYLTTLNLAAKFAPPIPPMPKDVQDKYNEYSRLLMQEEKRLSLLSPKEAQEEKNEIKEKVFSELSKNLTARESNK